ncbi:MAG: 4a-hydroxytetrahydrobiopterin dehydratase [Actinobacteria bacterium]|nr:4a-hydroxytetrahydrobiopterin dehydratase [Actinomycetota bacterium]
MAEPLDRSTIEAALGEGWEYDGEVVSREYAFDSFMDAITFINRVADAAEAADHHPEIRNVYNKVWIELSTHSAGAVTQKDLDLAAACDEAAT